MVSEGSDAQADPQMRSLKREGDEARQFDFCIFEHFAMFLPTVHRFLLIASLQILRDKSSSNDPG
jgi:hypothetical protein